MFCYVLFLDVFVYLLELTFHPSSSHLQNITLSSNSLTKALSSLLTVTSITKLTEDIKGLRVQKKNLSKDLVAAEKKEAAVKEEQSMKDLAKLLREKGLSVEDVRNMLDKESK